MENMKNFTGLTSDQVSEKIQQGLTNDFTAKTSSSTWDIIKRNVFTLFNALNFVIALALAFVQAWSNMVFFAVISFNALTGIMTELRAKRMIDKLNLMTKEKVDHSSEEKRTQTKGKSSSETPKGKGRRSTRKSTKRKVEIHYVE